MTERLQIYKCEICGNIVEMLQGGKGELICCGQPMKLFKENTIDASVEKHVPVVSREGSNINVKVGSVAHPMEESHYIQWIEVVSGDKAYRRFLKPGEAPEADFCIEGKDMTVREYCNIHGLWKS
ncbi:MAG: Desulfoferrodoxin [Actinobacteria bacterium ADurb.Bin346]|nr:MAG: Desulfoferrodoxin [Actinobacteria bacterium ADurb.Bin346]